MASPRPISGLLLAWTSEWSSFAEQAERIAAAGRSYPFAVAALHDYSLAYRQNLNSHPDGMTAVSLLKLLDYLHIATGAPATIDSQDDLFELIPAVRLSARADLERAIAASDHAAGAHATLGELYLVSGDQVSAADRESMISHYSQAAASPAVCQPMIDRLHLFESLGFRAGLVSTVLGMLAGEPPHSAP